MLLAPWQRWDTIHFQRIVESGYASPELTAFFPLYPLLGRLLLPLTGGNSLLALLLVSSVATLLALVALHSLAEQVTDHRTANRAPVALLALPTAFFLFAGYSEALTLLLVLVTLVWARRGHIGRAAVAGILAGLCSPMALPLVAALAVMQWREHRHEPVPIRLAAFAVPLAPLLGFALFLAWRAASGFPPWHQVHSTGWGVIIQWPWQTLASIPGLVGSPFLLLSGWANLLFLGLVLAMTVWAIRNLPLEWSVYQLAVVLFLLTVHTPDEPLSSLGRHSLLMPTLILGLAVWARTPARRRGGLFAGTSLQLILAGLFFAFIWVG